MKRLLCNLIAILFCSLGMLSFRDQYRKTSIQALDSDYYVLEIHRVYLGKVDLECFYCLISSGEGKLKALLTKDLSPGFYLRDTLRKDFHAKCILDNNTSYWESMCAIDTFAFRKQSSLEETFACDSLLRKLKDSANYTFRYFVSKKNKSGYYIGISKVINPAFRKIITLIPLCEFWGADSISNKLIILRKGFEMERANHLKCD